MLTISIVLFFAVIATYVLIDKRQSKKTVVDPKPIDIAEPIKEQPIEGVVLTPEESIASVSEETVAVETMAAKPKRKKAKKAE